MVTVSGLGERVPEAAWEGAKRFPLNAMQQPGGI